MGGRVGRERPTAARRDTYEIKDLAQLRVMADPLRVRILEVLCAEERTTKQVAELLGEPPTRLYHHVEMLRKAGLVEKTRTNPKRGTIEKYYKAVAGAFRAEGVLLRSSAARREGLGLSTMISRVFGGTAEELQRLSAVGAKSEARDREPEGALVAHTELHLSEAGLAELRSRLVEIVEDLQGAPEGDRRYRFTLAFFPLDRFDA